MLTLKCRYAKIASPNYGLYEKDNRNIVDKCMHT